MKRLLTYAFIATFAFITLAKAQSSDSFDTTPANFALAGCFSLTDAMRLADTLTDDPSKATDPWFPSCTFFDQPVFVTDLNDGNRLAIFTDWEGDPFEVWEFAQVDGNGNSLRTNLYILIWTSSEDI